MATAPDTAPIMDPETEELWSSRALLLVLLLLILSFWTSYYLKVRRIKSIHETIVALFAGMFVGLVIRVLPGVVVQGMLAFKNTIMLNVLLPPIILNSGFELKQENFFRNFATILVFAFAGTFISAVVLGVLVYIWALLGLEGLSLTVIECFQFGSTLSATDPVTILAIFNALKVDPKLYSVIFGESILNDAVAIVMFETLSQFHGEKVHVLSFFHGVGIFLLVFCTSMALGVIFGLGCSLLLKHSSLANYPEIECCLVTLIAYTSYFFSNGMTMSGIVSLLFCGITLKHYAYHNMSRRTQRATKYMFQTLAQLCENFIFIYLGLSLFTQTQLVYKPIFILVTALGVCVARYCAVFPISKVINVIARSRGATSPELPHSYQMMLFWAGLRGAVGVALAAGLKGENAAALRTTVLVTVVLTMIIFGGTTTRMIDIVGIRTGVEDDDDSSDDEAVPYVAGRGPAWMSLDGKYPMKNPDERDLSPASATVADPSDAPYRDYRERERERERERSLGWSLSNHGHGPGSPLPRNVSTGSFESTESFDDNEVLPTAVPTEEGLSATAVWRDGQWFNVLDEQYLLPVFSNATASRKQASKQATRKALRKTKSKLDVDASNQEADLANGGQPSPVPSDTSMRHSWMGPSSSTRMGTRVPESELSFQTVLSSLINSSSAPATPTSPSMHKKRESGNNEPRATFQPQDMPSSSQTHSASQSSVSLSNQNQTSRRMTSQDASTQEGRRSFGNLGSPA